MINIYVSGDEEYEYLAAQSEKGNWECFLNLSVHGFSPDPWLPSVAYALQAVLWHKLDHC